ncbi:hypothetical protein HHI36_011012 [Cryptolaemus montrouzieri]|uniref:J domain-containing protein n=1 Tax=Cryptolaemus montrouzieri TaxID=559131 RepID=A0ABD2MKL8_9CUCU
MNVHVLKIPNVVLFRNIISDNKILYVPWNSKTTFYDILKVKNDCSSKEIKDSYLKLSKLHHPDKIGNSKESHHKFLEINEAYKTLSKADLRKSYDFYITLPQSSPEPRMNYNEFHDWSTYQNPIFHKDKTTNSSRSNNSYYGVKGIKKQGNFMIVLICFFLSVFGLSIQVFMVSTSASIRRDKLQKQQEENELLLHKIKETSALNGKDAQIELLRQKFEENELRKKGY